MVCPECHAEHIAGATECRDCLVPLVVALPAVAPQARTPRSALAGSDGALAVCALAVGAVVLVSLLLSIAVRAGMISDDAYDSSLVHIAGAAPSILLGPLLAWTALAARHVAPLARGRGLLAAAAVAGLVGAALLISYDLADSALTARAMTGWWSALLAGLLAIGAAMVLLAVGLLRARLASAPLAGPLLVSVVLMAVTNLVVSNTFGSVLYDVAWGAQGVFWVALGVFCLPRRGVSPGSSGLSSAQLTRRSS